MYLVLLMCFRSNFFFISCIANLFFRDPIISEQNLSTRWYLRSCSYDAVWSCWSHGGVRMWWLAATTRTRRTQFVLSLHLKSWQSTSGFWALLFEMDSFCCVDVWWPIWLVHLVLIITTSYLRIMCVCSAECVAIFANPSHLPTSPVLLP